MFPCVRSVHTDDEATPAKEQEGMRTEWGASWTSFCPLEPNWRACRCSLSRVRCDFQVRKGAPYKMVVSLGQDSCGWGSMAVKGWKDRWTVPHRGVRISPAYSAGTWSWCQACLWAASLSEVGWPFQKSLHLVSTASWLFLVFWPELFIVIDPCYICSTGITFREFKETVAIFPPEN